MFSKILAINGTYNGINEETVVVPFPFKPNTSISIQFRNQIGFSNFSDKFRILNVTPLTTPFIPGGTIAAVSICVVILGFIVIITIRK